MSAAVYRQTRLAWRFVPHAFEFPGLAHPLTVYQVVQPQFQPRKTRGLETMHAELIGRDAELAKLMDAAHELQAGRGAWIGTSGEAGVGKSRLIAELRTLLIDADGASSLLWLEGRCLEMTEATPYGPFVDLLHTYFVQRGENQAGDVAQSIRSVLDGLVRQGLLAVEQSGEIGPLLGNLLAIPFGDSWDEVLANADPQQTRHRTFAALHALLTALARQQPMIVVLEDLHWADSLSIDLIGQLMETLASEAILLLCIYRPSQEHRSRQLVTQAARKCPGRYLEIRLHELSPDQSRRQLVSLLGNTKLADPIVTAILDKSQGNPFFTEELVRSLIDRGVLHYDGAQWQARDKPAMFALPESVQTVFLSRMDQLEPPVRQILQLAAVVGYVVPRPILARCVAEPTELDFALSRLEEAGFIYLERSIPQVEYVFRHILTQEAVYRTLVRRQRFALHRQVAQAIETVYSDSLAERYEQLAHHYDQGDIPEKAVEYLLKAGEKAGRAYLNDDAIGYFERALARLDALADWKTEVSPSVRLVRWRLCALTNLGQTLPALRDMEAAEAHLRDAIALCHQIGRAGEELAQLYAQLSETLFWQNRFDDMYESSQAGLVLLGGEQTSAASAALHHSISLVFLGKGRARQADEYTERDSQFLRQLPYRPELRPPYYTQCKHYLFIKKDVAGAMRWAESLFQHGQAIYDMTAQIEAERVVAEILSAQGDYSQAVHRLQSSYQLAVKVGDLRHSHWALEKIGMVQLTLGKLQAVDEALAKISPLIQKVEVEEDSLTPDVRLKWLRSRCHASLLMLCRGEWQDAVKLVQVILNARRQFNLPVDCVTSLLLLGRAYLCGGERQVALECFQEAFSMVGTFDIDILMPRQACHFEETCDSLSPGYLLNGIESACGDDASFQSLCWQLRTRYADYIHPAFTQWCLEPATPDPCFARAMQVITSQAMTCVVRSTAHRENEHIDDSWIWHDPYSDCAWSVEDGLVLHAANGRHLRHVNLSAPRLLCPLTGDFAIQTVTLPGAVDRPAIGGLLLWKDAENYLRLDRGTRGSDEISFAGAVNNLDIAVGRGLLRHAQERAARVWLRLERVAGQVRALCSADGDSWLTVGAIDFALPDPVQIGIHAIGYIDRSVYPGAYAEGTAIRFGSPDGVISIGRRSLQDE